MHPDMLPPPTDEPAAAPVLWPVWGSDLGLVRPGRKLRARALRRRRLRAVAGDCIRAAREPRGSHGNPLFYEVFGHRY